MLSTLYAYQAYFYCFQDESLVAEAVMPDSIGNTTYWTNSEREDVYKDDLFGMNSIRKLVIWVTAADGDNVEGTPQVEAQNFLLDYFAD